MVKTRLIQVRLTRDELQQLKGIAESKHYASVSDLIRKTAIGDDLWLERKIQEMYLLLKEIKTTTDLLSQCKCL